MDVFSRSAKRGADYSLFAGLAARHVADYLQTAQAERSERHFM
jgi:hypothetical protein